MIPYGRQDISEADIEAVVEVLRSDYLTQGPAVARFEDEVARHCGATHAVAVNSGTSALHLACLALGVGPEDRVWTSAITFAASANCAAYCGARVDFVDIDAQTWNMSPAALAAKLERARRANALPKVVIPVHLGGQPCDMPAIHALAREYGFRVIEDASHALGATVDGRPVGDGRHGDITVFSFHPVKVITTAEGGMAVTNDAAQANAMRLLRSHGITREAAELTRPAEGPWYYEQVALGFNYRLTDLQAALGRSQLARLASFLAARERLARRYDELLAGLPLARPHRDAGRTSAWHLYVVRLRLDRLARSHLQVFEGLRAAGIGANLHYIPVYRQPYYARMGFEPSDFPEAERYYAEAISLPLHPRLADAEQAHVAATLRALCA